MKNQSFRKIASTILVLFILAVSVNAGPPLICHPFEIGEAKSIAWNGKQWRDVQKDYDINRLVPDVMAILETDAPIFVRMETMRRASVYAVWSRIDWKVGYWKTGFDPKDDRIARELLDKIVARAKTAEARGLKTRADKLALFDAGYLIETYKHIGFEQSANKTAVVNYDGLAWTEKANAALGCPGETELALAIMMHNYKDKKDQQAKHLKTALAQTKDGSLLAKNIVTHFPERGTNLSALRASLQ